MICATNSLLYLNQSVPPYGVSLNSIADHSTEFPLSKNQLLNTSDHIVAYCEVPQIVALVTFGFCRIALSLLLEVCNFQ